MILLARYLTHTNTIAATKRVNTLKMMIKVSIPEFSQKLVSAIAGEIVRNSQEAVYMQYLLLFIIMNLLFGVRY
jgi:hypothetical protein